jgi:hypothetical protein
MKNVADFEIKTFVSVAYPDSSLKSSRGDKHIEPGQELFVGTYYDLMEYDGITLFVFRYDYYLSRRSQGFGTPDTYLAQDSMLARYYLSRRQLDSLDWKLTYP